MRIWSRSTFLGLRLLVLISVVSVIPIFAWFRILNPVSSSVLDSVRKFTSEKVGRDLSVQIESVNGSIVTLKNVPHGERPKAQSPPVGLHPRVIETVSLSEAKVSGSDVASCPQRENPKQVNTSTITFPPHTLDLDNFICPGYYSVAEEVETLKNKLIDTDQHSGHASQQRDICIAMSAGPRAHRQGNVTQLLLNLLEALGTKRTNSTSATRTVAQRFYAIIYSSACTHVRTFAPSPSTGGPLHVWEVPPNSTSSIPYEDINSPEIATRFLRAARKAAAELPFPSVVVEANRAICELVSNLPFLQSITPERFRVRNDWPRFQWRTKATLDMSYSLRQCMATNPKFILLLEDDIMPAWGYDRKMEEFMRVGEKQHGWWEVLALYFPRSYSWRVVHAEEYKIPCCTQVRGLGTGD